MSYIFYRDYPEYVAAEKLTVNDTPYVGTYQMGWTATPYGPPASWSPGPVLSSVFPAGTWHVWVKVDNSPEHPVVLLGRVIIR